MDVEPISDHCLAATRAWPACCPDHELPKERRPWFRPAGSRPAGTMAR
ncbi:hypothetical protein [Nocardioides terrisoli]|nr:hypothetical protein [Nocardioides marmorisolisilvae]